MIRIALPSGSLLSIPLGSAAAEDVATPVSPSLLIESRSLSSSFVVIACMRLSVGSLLVDLAVSHLAIANGTDLDDTISISARRTAPTEGHKGAEGGEQRKQRRTLGTDWVSTGLENNLFASASSCDQCSRLALQPVTLETVICKLRRESVLERSPPSLPARFSIAYGQSLARHRCSFERTRLVVPSARALPPSPRASRPVQSTPPTRYHHREDRQRRVDQQSTTPVHRSQLLASL